MQGGLNFGLCIFSNGLMRIQRMSNVFQYGRLVVGEA